MIYYIFFEDSNQSPRNTAEQIFYPKKFEKKNILFYSYLTHDFCYNLDFEFKNLVRYKNHTYVIEHNLKSRLHATYNTPKYRITFEEKKSWW